MTQTNPKPQKLQIALAQMGSSADENAANIARLGALLDDAHDERIDLLLTPELLNTGYFPDRFADRCEPEDGPSERAVAAMAKRRGAAVVAGFGVRDGEALANEAVVFDPDGATVARYRKMHLFVSSAIDESDYFARGTEPSMATVAGVEAGLAICYDLRFPELFRRYFAREAPMICVISAFPAARSEHWRTLIRARAIENQCFVLACNRSGEDDGLRFAGASAIIDPWGQTLSEAGQDDIALVRAEIDLSECVRARRRIPCHRSLAPELHP